MQGSSQLQFIVNDVRPELQIAILLVQLEGEFVKVRIRICRADKLNSHAVQSRTQHGLAKGPHVAHRTGLVDMLYRHAKGTPSIFHNCRARLKFVAHGICNGGGQWADAHLHTQLAMSCLRRNDVDGLLIDAGRRC